MQHRKKNGGHCLKTATHSQLSQATRQSCQKSRTLHRPTTKHATLASTANIQPLKRAYLLLPSHLKSAFKSPKFPPQLPT